MSEEVPDGWVDVSLGELLREPLRNGHSARPSLDGSGVRALTLTAVTYGEFSEKNTKMTVADPTKVADLWLEPGDLLIERSNTPELVGTARLYRGPRQWAIFPDLLIRARLLEAASPDYVEALLLSHGSRNYFMESAQGTAGSMPKIDQGVIERLRVPLPPLVEQSRIVEMVDALLAQLSAARQRLASVLLILKRFRQSVLAAACSGKLTEDWRQRDVQDEVIAVESSLPNSWSGATLGELATLVTSGSRGWAQHYSDVGPLFIRAQDINTDALVLDEVAHVRPPRGAEGLRTRVAPGDLLVTITGANVTRTAWVDRSIGEAYVSQHVGLVRPSDRSVTPFLHAWLCSPAHGRAALIEAAYGAGKPGLNLENLRSLEVVMPPVEERTLILKRMLELLALADAIERRITVASARADVLTQSILAKAFRGELVPTEAELARAEGRNYESAEALLARIQADRSTGVHSPRPSAARGG